MCQSESYNWGYSFVNYFANVLFKKMIFYMFSTQMNVIYNFQKKLWKQPKTKWSHKCPQTHWVCETIIQISDSSTRMDSSIPQKWKIFCFSLLSKRHCHLPVSKVTIVSQINKMILLNHKLDHATVFHKLVQNLLKILCFKNICPSH